MLYNYDFTLTEMDTITLFDVLNRALVKVDNECLAAALSTKKHFDYYERHRDYCHDLVAKVKAANVSGGHFIFTMEDIHVQNFHDMIQQVVVMELELVMDCMVAALKRGVKDGSLKDEPDIKQHEENSKYIEGLHEKMKYTLVKLEKLGDETK